MQEHISCNACITVDHIHTQESTVLYTTKQHIQPAFWLKLHKDRCVR